MMKIFWSKRKNTLKSRNYPMYCQGVEQHWGSLLVTTGLSVQALTILQVALTFPAAFFLLWLRQSFDLAVSHRCFPMSEASLCAVLARVHVVYPSKWAVWMYDISTYLPSQMARSFIGIYDGGWVPGSYVAWIELWSLLLLSSSRSSVFISETHWASITAILAGVLFLILKHGGLFNLETSHTQCIVHASPTSIVQEQPSQSVDWLGIGQYYIPNGPTRYSSRFCLSDKHGCWSWHISNFNSASIKHPLLLLSPTASSQPTLPHSIHHLSSIIHYQWQIPTSSLLNSPSLNFPNTQ